MHKGKEAPLTASSPLNQPTEDMREKRGAVMKGGFMKWNMVLSWLVFSAVGWMVPAATIIYKQLASLLAEEHVQSYHKTKSWSKCVPNNFLLRLSITCIHACSSTNSACRMAALSEGQLDLWLQGRAESQAQAC